MIDNSKSIIDDQIDSKADESIAKCVTNDPPISFFLFAGAGSGKTHSLVKALQVIKNNVGARFRINGRRVGVITYTNKACKEIIQRIEYDDLFAVSTIHSFSWSMIKGLNHDIKEWLKINLRNEIEDLEGKERKGRPGTKISSTRLNAIAAKNERLNVLDDIKKFIYNPGSDNPERNALNHAEVIKITSSFLTKKPLMQSLLVNRFPILLIDESQDTDKELMEAFFHVQKNLKNRFSLGVIGDMMQRIYMAGKLDLDRNLPDDWKTPIKKMNHRSCPRILKLINRIRQPVDDKTQQSRSDKSEGFVRFFILPAETTDKPAHEHAIYKRMAAITKDNNWLEPDKHVKTLILEHRMAANRLNFLPMWDALSGVARLQTGLRDGTLPGLRFFSHLILPLIDAHFKKNSFAVASIIRKNSPLIEKNTLEKYADDQMGQMRKAKDAVESLTAIWSDGKIPTFSRVIETIHETNLFRLPEILRTFADINEKQTEEDENIEDDKKDALVAWGNFLDTSFDQIERYSQYIQGEAQYDTHQGIKGLEFPRVCVIMDDSEARGFMFPYEKLFGAKKESKKKDPTKETSIDRTRRLFYVTCSRAEDSLALIAYTSQQPEQVRDHILKKDWFEEHEIVSSAQATSFS